MRPGFAIFIGLVLALALGIALGPWLRRRWVRWRVRAQPFPEEWRRVLDRHVDFWRALDDAERARFEREVQFFLADQHISGPRGAVVDDETRVLVAASAVILTFGRRDYVWPRLRDVVVYPDAFDDEYRVAKSSPVLGMVHGQGPVIFSAKALRRGFAKEHDGENVGIHEFAHVLDFEGGAAQADGVPSLMPWKSIAPWLERMHLETTRVKKKRSVLRRYAATNEAEFFAVATEAFFERPRASRDRHPELYALLCETYGQDPANRVPKKGDTQRNGL